MAVIENLITQVQEYKQMYARVAPFPHLILDNFFPAPIAEKMANDFPQTPQKKNWIHYQHFNENKHGLNVKSEISSSILEAIEYFNAPKFISFLEQLTGIENLLADDTLEGGGIHISKKGGYLNIHADFETHPKNSYLVRRINVLLYLNKNWKEEYKGDLEFWSSDMEKCVVKVAPIFNRLVIFNTTNISYHGFSEKLNCPETEIRKSLALYYYTKSEQPHTIKSTTYKTKPGDGLKVIPNWIDNKLLYGYTLVKRKLGLKDESISRVLNIRNWFR